MLANDQVYIMITRLRRNDHFIISILLFNYRNKRGKLYRRNKPQWRVIASYFEECHRRADVQIVSVKV